MRSTLKGDESIWLIAGPATTGIVLTGITGKVLFSDSTFAGAPKDRTRDWKSCAFSRAPARPSKPYERRSLHLGSLPPKVVCSHSPSDLTRSRYLKSP